MGRPLGTGLSYFSFDCNFFHDKKIKLIKSEFGAKGILVLVCVLTRIYGDEGYFLCFDADEAMLIADELGCGIDEQFVQEVVKGCVRRSIFDDGVLNMFGVLTSKGIQKRFLQAVRAREYVRFKQEYFLLDTDYLDKEGIPENLQRKVLVDGVSLKENIVSLKETTQRKEKKRKEKRIEENDKETPVVTVEKYAQDNLGYLSPRAMQELVSFKEDMAEDLIFEAIDASCNQNIRNWAYTRSILNAYLDAGYKTVGEVRAAEEARRKKKQAQQAQAESKNDKGEKVIWRD